MANFPFFSRILKSILDFKTGKFEKFHRSGNLAAPKLPEAAAGDNPTSPEVQDFLKRLADVTSYLDNAQQCVNEIREIVDRRKGGVLAF